MHQVKETVLYSLFLLISFASCKKSNNDIVSGRQLYPLAQGNKWTYVDSFFNPAGIYTGKDSFTLKTTKTINFNNLEFTPITDQWDDSIFILRSDDTTVHILEHPDEALFFRKADHLPVLISSQYNANTYSSLINTQQITNTPFPSYKIIITQDEGPAYNYRQQELYFSIGIGIIKGRDIRKTNTGNEYIFDAYTLISRSLY